MSLSFPCPLSPCFFLRTLWRSLSPQFCPSLKIFGSKARSAEMPALHCPGFLTANGDLQKVVGMFSCRPPMVVRRKLTCFRRGCGRGRWMRRFSVSCVAEEEVKTRRIRKYCPVLESKPFTTDDVIAANEWKAVPDIWRTSADRYGDKVALVDPYHDPPSTLTYKQLEQEILNFAEGLRVSGILPNEKVALFADNSCRWLVADQGIMAMGAINVVRGSRSSSEELLQIYNHSGSVALVVDGPDFFSKLIKSFSTQARLRFVILLWGDKSSLDGQMVADTPIFSYQEITDIGQSSRYASSDTLKEGQQLMYKPINPEDIATLVYTSGTTGIPKGVMLTHQNFLHQIKNMWDVVPARAGDRFLSMLPPWHAYERACEYFIFTNGVQQMYTNVKFLKEDLQRYQPHYLISVPLVYETLHSGIHRQISASSSVRKIIAFSFIRISLMYMDFRRIYEGKVLPMLQNQQLSSVPPLLVWLWAGVMTALFWPLHMLGVKLVYSKIHASLGISKAIGIRLQNGYGLTETSPVVAARRPEYNVLGTVGHPLRSTEIKIVDLETGSNLPTGQKGIVKVRGPQVMKGYYKNEDATIKVLDKEGWLDTGDIGWIVPSSSTGPSRNCSGMLVLEGRLKDTIVLSTGENVEPSEIEEAAIRSNLIRQIIVLGQDQRRLGALIVPNKEELLLAARQCSRTDELDVHSRQKIFSKLIRDELTFWTSQCSFQIGPFLLLDEPFSIDNGLLTPTMKIRRDQVVARYSDEVAKLFM
ncbi:putative acyl-activating enzyme 16 [Nymphaea thermarum]|nr:putative acyl-activating enzyme 16 [Nymphaea thermarum]